MHPRKANSFNNAPLRSILYAMLLLFLLITCISLLRDGFQNPSYTLNTSVHQLEREKCNLTESKRELISKLEPILAEEPMEVWEGLGKEDVKYLPDMIDFGSKKRFIYVDLGAREYESSIGSWFNKQYPKQNKPFEIFAVEADEAFHKDYRSKQGVTLLPFAAWIKNETVVFGSKPIIVKDKVWRMRPFGRIEGDKTVEDKLSKVVKVQAFDFIEWLRRTVKEDDFVVVKMDIEGTEITLIKKLVETGAICLIDELFMECHFDRFVKCCSGERINRFNYTYHQCYDLFSQLREKGSYVHQWW